MSNEIVGVLLAAGLSNRMGQENKLLLKVSDQLSMVRYSVETLLESKIDHLYVVVGFEASAVENELRGLSVTIVNNRDYQNGQASSVRAGFSAIDKKYKAVLLALSDQPFLISKDIDKFIDEFFKTKVEQVFIPYCDEQRGNPIILPKSYVSEILCSSKNLACKNYTKKNPHSVHKYETLNQNFFKDLDTPEAYQEFLRINNNGQSCPQ